MSLRSPIPTPRLRISMAVALALLAASALTHSPACAGPIGLQASGGWYTDSGTAFLGAGARFGFGSITVIPNGSYLFVDKVTTYSLNVDGTLSVLPLGVASGYVGAGLGWFTVDPDNGDSHTDMVYDLIAGAGLNAIPLKPFGQFKYVVKDGDDPLVIEVGVRF